MDKPTGLIAEVGIVRMSDGRIGIDFTLHSKTSETFDKAPPLTSGPAAGWYDTFNSGFNMDVSTKAHAKPLNECTDAVDKRTRKAVYSMANSISYRLQDEGFDVRDKSDNSFIFSGRHTHYIRDDYVHERTDHASSHFIASTTEPATPETVFSRLEEVIGQAMVDNSHALNEYMRSRPGTEIAPPRF